jgi:Zn-dependent peptidase ImmA (M78 family)
MAKKKNPGSIFTVEKVKIGGIDWNFIPDKDDSRLGCCSTPDNHYIKINMHQWNKADEDYIDTVLHECLHAICNMKLLSKHHLKESQIIELAAGLEELIIDNPKFVKWLSEYADWVRQERKKK